MNVSGIGTDSTTLANFIETAIPFTAVTIWVLVAFQTESETLSSRLWWPVTLLRQLVGQSTAKRSAGGVALGQVVVDKPPKM